MKKKAALIILVLTMISILSVPVFAEQAMPVSSSTVSKSTVSKKYESYRKKKGISQYKLIDIDKNGINEMIYYVNGTCCVCTYNPKTKKVCSNRTMAIGRSTPLVFYSTLKHHVVLYSLTTSSYEAVLYTVSGKCIIKTKTFYASYALGEQKIYKINNKKVSESKFMKEWKKINGKYKKAEFHW